MIKGSSIVSLTLYDSLEANHKIVIEVSYAVTLERRNKLTYHATSGRATCVDDFDIRPG